MSKKILYECLFCGEKVEEPCSWLTQQYCFNNPNSMWIWFISIGLLGLGIYLL